MLCEKDVNANISYYTCVLECQNFHTIGFSMLTAVVRMTLDEMSISFVCQHIKSCYEENEFEFQNVDLNGQLPILCSALNVFRIITHL